MTPDHLPPPEPPFALAVLLDLGLAGLFVVALGAIAACWSVVVAAVP